MNSENNSEDEIFFMDELPDESEFTREKNFSYETPMDSSAGGNFDIGQEFRSSGTIKGVQNRFHDRYKEDKLSGKNIFKNTWKIMIVDDAEDVHDITRMVFEDYSFKGRPIECLSAYSGKEAEELIKLHPETAVILLDVVMETDHAGLDLVHFIREELKNNFVRIILRTGQPGEAPEEKVILEYDINDYKTKEELTNKKLYTSVTAALRAFQDLKNIEKNRKGLKMIIDATSDFFKFSSPEQFAASILHEVTAIPWLKDKSLFLVKNYLYGKRLNDDIQSGNISDKEPSFGTEGNPGQSDNSRNFYILAGTGPFKKIVGKRINDIGDDRIIKAIQQGIELKKTCFLKKCFICYFAACNDMEIILYFENTRVMNNTDHDLIEIFLSNLALAVDIFYHRLNLEKLVKTRTSQLNLEKEKVKKAQSILSKYVPKQLAEKIMAGEIDDVWGYSRKKLTLFFSDIKDFTGTTESMEPEDMAGLLNEYLTEMYCIAKDYGGLVANTNGDGLFIFFGALGKCSSEKNAVSCVNMAVAMQNKMAELKEKWFNEGICEPLQIRCGINTGMVNIGGFGSNDRKIFTAMGMQVNLASRLETAGTPGGILISHSTWALVKDDFKCSSRGGIKVKGFSHPVIAYDVIF